MKSELEIFLSKLKKIKEPKIRMEQYNTPEDVAADILNIVDLSENFEGKKVLDFGTGNGIFAIGAGILGARAIGIDKDKNAIKIAKENLRIAKSYFPEIKVKFLVMDVADFRERADIVIMNPPFGLKIKGLNLIFLENAMGITNRIYALLHHSKTKTAEKTAEFIKNFARKKNFIATILKSYNFEIPKIYKFHRREKIWVKTNLYFFRREQNDKGRCEG